MASYPSCTRPRKRMATSEALLCPHTLSVFPFLYQAWWTQGEPLCRACCPPGLLQVWGPGPAWSWIQTSQEVTAPSTSQWPAKGETARGLPHWALPVSFLSRPPSSSISNERTFILLEWCALSHFSHVRLFETPWLVACQAPLSMGFSSKNPGVCCHCLLQGIFPTQGSDSVSRIAGRFFTTELYGKPLLEWGWGLRELGLLCESSFHIFSALLLSTPLCTNSG